MKKIFLLAFIICSYGAFSQSYLRTNIPVEYNKAGEIVGKDTSIVIGKITSVNWSSDFNSLGVAYEYSDTTGVILKRGYYTKTAAEVNALYAAVKNLLPVTDNYIYLQRSIYYIAFRIIAAQTFGINTSQITLSITE